MPHPSTSTLTVSYSSEERVVAGYNGQFTPCGYLSTLQIHTTLAGFEPTTSSATDSFTIGLPAEKSFTHPLANPYNFSKYEAWPGSRDPEIFGR